MRESGSSKGLYARWYDRNAFSLYNMVQFCGRFAKAYKELDPQARTGFEGTDNFRMDYDAIFSTNQFWCTYPLSRGHVGGPLTSIHTFHC